MQIVLYTISVIGLLHCFFRYFECKPMYGLFAPVSKVTRMTGAVTSTPRSGRLPMGTSLSRQRSGSQESVSSISSNTSTASRSRVRLGVTSLGNQVLYSDCYTRMFLYVFCSRNKMYTNALLEKFGLVLHTYRI